ncbi:MAG: hypothetical protein UT24_C0029G0020 [Candidatus Woesebacteria bacterium GW2011_GWB1_39_12]|uniref:Holin n=1 Tax=Candidatus Woesebacteria bacterium GW2011_GWB1_39_12 TaxID=1618574 RepID=A0A0G0M491_9BACT|nr:MAG: hypothetical protein UT24_C0029G0020 [Candidatus Woesebacteria bacterium GW2011_GWB1_39_12]
MNEKNKEAIIEGLKEAGRLALLAGVSYLVTLGLNLVADMPETQTTVILTFVLKSLDKWLYKKDKTVVPVKGATGLTGF